METAERKVLLARWNRATARRLILDYDGTLVPLQARPELAAPDEDTLELLRRMCGWPDIRILLASGRDRRTLDDWFGDLGIDLVAEHGFFIRIHGRGWVEAMPVREVWLDEAHEIQLDAASRYPGSVVERKEHTIAWHYRGVPEADRAEAVHELLRNLSQARSRSEFDVLRGHSVIEVRSLGPTKGTAATGWLAANPGDLVIAIGDDATDEDLFRSLPDQAVTIRVGEGFSGARSRISTPAEVRQLLDELDRPRSAVVDPAPSPSSHPD